MNFLDLRKEASSRVQTVKEVVYVERSFWSELFKMLGVIVITSIVGWGISNADMLTLTTEGESFSAVGTVSVIDGNTITINDANGSDGGTNTSYDLNVSNIEKVETNKYMPLTLANIQVGDRVIAQGISNGTYYDIKRLISFSVYQSVDATTTATSTDATATTTPETATTTATTTDTTGGGGSSPAPVATTTETVATSTETTATTTTQTETASTTATTTDTTATTTPPVEEPATTTPVTPPTPDPVPPPASDTPATDTATTTG